MLGTTEIIIILAIALLVFGPTKLPEIGRQIGSAMRELRKMSSDVQRALDIDDITRYDPPSYGSTYTYNGNGDYSNPDKTRSYENGGDPTDDDDALTGDYPYISEPAALASASGIEAGEYDGEPVNGAEDVDAAAPFVEPPGPTATTVAAERETATSTAVATDKE